MLRRDPLEVPDCIATRPAVRGENTAWRDDPLELIVLVHNGKPLGGLFDDPLEHFVQPFRLLGCGPSHHRALVEPRSIAQPLTEHDTDEPIMGIDDRVGALRPGLDGDVVIWDGDPLDVMSRAVQVFVSGREVYSYADGASVVADPYYRESSDR